MAREESATTSSEAAEGDEEDEMNRAEKMEEEKMQDGESDEDVPITEERKNACMHPYAYVYTRRETRPIVIAIPTGEMFLQYAVSCRPATKPEQTHPTVRSRPSNGATGCTTFHLPSCLPPAIHAVHIHTAHGRIYSLYERSTEEEKEREERKRERRG